MRRDKRRKRWRDAETPIVRSSGSDSVANRHNHLQPTLPPIPFCLKRNGKIPSCRIKTGCRCSTNGWKDFPNRRDGWVKQKISMWVVVEINIGKTMNISSPTLPIQRFERKVRKIPILSPHLSHIPIEICSDSITFRCKPSLKSRIQRKADANKVSMTKILLWMADKHFGSSFTDEDEEK